MLQWTSPGDVPEGFGPSVVTIGNFDGVHLGHQEILERVVDAARAAGQSSVVVTFEPHPMHVLYPESAPPLLCSIEQRSEQFAAAGVDVALVLPFTQQLAHMSPREFVQTYLIDALAARRVVIGEDIRFGWHNEGDIEVLRALGFQLGFEVEAVGDVSDPTGPEHARRWSSTWARELIECGDVVGARAILGRWHSVRATVVHGDARGHELGFPTANLGADLMGLVPADGVYAGWLLRPDHEGDDVRLPAAISIGTNPTFDGSLQRVEAHVLDRDDLELYGECVVLEFVERLRPTQRFSGVDELITQMRDDVAKCHAVLKA